MDIPFIERHTTKSDPAGKFVQDQRRRDNQSEMVVEDYHDKDGDVGYEEVKNDEYLEMWEKKGEKPEEFILEKLKEYKGYVRPKDTVNSELDVYLDINENALRRYTEIELDSKGSKSEAIKNSENLKRLFRTCAESPEKIKAVGFESDGHQLTDMVMIDKDGNEITVALPFLRSTVNNVSGSENPKTKEMTGIRFSTWGGQKLDIYPQLNKEGVKKVMQHVDIGGNKFGYSVDFFIRNSNGIPVDIPIREKATV